MCADSWHFTGVLIMRIVWRQLEKTTCFQCTALTRVIDLIFFPSLLFLVPPILRFLFLEYIYLHPARPEFLVSSPGPCVFLSLTSPSLHEPIISLSSIVLSLTLSEVVYLPLLLEKGSDIMLSQPRSQNKCWISGNFAFL